MLTHLRTSFSKTNFDSKEKFFKRGKTFNNFFQFFWWQKNRFKPVLVVFLQVSAWWGRRGVQPLDGLPGCQLGPFFGQAAEGRLESGLPDGDGQVVDGRAELGHVAGILDVGPEVGQVRQFRQVRQILDEI